MPTGLKNRPDSDQTTDDELTATEHVNTDLRQAGKDIYDKENTATDDNSPWLDKTSDSSKHRKGSLWNPKNWSITVSGARKRGPIAVIVTLLTLGGIGVGSMLTPLMLPVHLLQNVVAFNDSASTSMTARFPRVFQHMNGKAGDPMCTSKKFKCKAGGKISNSALRRLEKRGVRACFNGDCSKAATKRLGYPENHPDKYRFTAKDGSQVDVETKDLKKFLSTKGNLRYASQVFGPVGAINFRVQAWFGKHIASKFYRMLGLKRIGGMLDGVKTKYGDAKAKLAGAKAKMTSKIPTAQSLEGKAGNLSKKLEGKLNRAKKGGLGYLGAVAACIAPQIPRYVASGVAAIQLAQITAVAMDSFLSPSAKIQASGLDKKYEVIPENQEGLWLLLTNRTPRESDGKLTSALDSPILLAALGINTGKPKLSKEFVPGYGVLSDPKVKFADNLAEASKQTCDVVMHPATMYAAMATDIAITVLASATIVLGILKVAGQWAVGKLVAAMLKTAATKYFADAVQALARNDAIPKATGQKLGDVLGIGLAAFFSAGSMARSLPTLTMSQLSEYNTIRRDVLAMEADMERSSLSPFDVSSKHTFLGSIVYQLQTSMMTQGNILNKLFAIMPNPAVALSSSAQASVFNTNYCSYYDDMATSDNMSGGNLLGGLIGGDEGADEDPAAINLAGLPCTGLTKDQLNMSTQEAIDLLTAESWLDNEIEVEETDTIGDLITRGVIKKDTPLYDYIMQCSDASSGSYIYDAKSCTTLGISGEPHDGTCIVDPDLVVDSCPEDIKVEVKGIGNPMATIAMPVFLLDYQIMQSVNGNDDEVPTDTSEDGDDTTLEA